jgi:hypothetical protein
MFGGKLLERPGLKEPLFPVECKATPLLGNGLPEAISYRPGGRVVGIKGSWPDMDAWMRYMATIKSDTSNDPRPWVSDRFLREIHEHECVVKSKSGLTIFGRVSRLGAWI